VKGWQRLHRHGQIVDPAPKIWAVFAANQGRICLHPRGRRWRIVLPSIKLSACKGFTTVFISPAGFAEKSSTFQALRPRGGLCGCGRRLDRRAYFIGEIAGASAARSAISASGSKVSDRIAKSTGTLAALHGLGAHRSDAGANLCRVSLQIAQGSLWGGKSAVGQGHVGQRSQRTATPKTPARPPRQPAVVSRQERKRKAVPDIQNPVLKTRLPQGVAAAAAVATEAGQGNAPTRLNRAGTIRAHKRGIVQALA